MDYQSLSIIPGLTENILSDRFNQIDRMFSKLTGKKPLSEIPDYDLIKKNNKEYQLRVCVPGYKRDELNIIIEENKLIIKGNIKKEIKNKEKKEEEFIYNGINKKSFSISFNFDHKVKNKKAKLKKGILELNFAYDLPKQIEPQKILIE